jgi:hypothetical protein
MPEHFRRTAWSFTTQILALYTVLRAKKCLRKYSCPLPLEPRIFERQTNMLRGQLRGSSGSSQDIRKSPFQAVNNMLNRIAAFASACFDKLKRIFFKLWRRRQPAHALRADIAINQGSRPFAYPQVGKEFHPASSVSYRH